MHRLLKMTYRCAPILTLSLALLPTPFTGPQAQEKPASKIDKKAGAVDSKKDNDKLITNEQAKHPILWQDPGKIALKNLFYGLGGRKDLPAPPFIFLDEDKGGSNPKFDVRDANGKKWHGKLGEEPRPEVVSSRLLWAVGYFANDDYLVKEATIAGMKMKRGDSDAKRGHIQNARFSRKPKGQDKIGTWAWKNNPFNNTREFNGLRVMMAVLNNWDLKDENNSVYRDKRHDRDIFLVNDIGATFGTNGLSWSKSRSKGNVEQFEKSEFIQSKTDTTVSFGTPKAPHAILVESFGFAAKDYSYRSGLNWIGNDIPLADARWIGGLLGQLSHQQLLDAFRAGNWPADEVNTYVQIVEERIAALKAL